MSVRVAQDDLVRAYAALGLPLDAPAAAIKARYRELASQHHPDKWPAGSAEHAEASNRMRTINVAYDLIEHAPLRHGIVADEPPQGGGNAAGWESSGWESAAWESSRGPTAESPHSAPGWEGVFSIRRASPLWALAEVVFIALFVIGCFVTYPGRMVISIVTLGIVLSGGSRVTFVGLILFSAFMETALRFVGQ
jgi:hypothetical protein